MRKLCTTETAMNGKFIVKKKKKTEFWGKGKLKKDKIQRDFN